MLEGVQRSANADVRIHLFHAPELPTGPTFHHFVGGVMVELAQDSGVFGVHKGNAARLMVRSIRTVIIAWEHRRFRSKPVASLQFGGVEIRTSANFRILESLMARV